ncbi:MAG: DUF6447 family protein [Pseudomonadota bacterium]
MADANQGQSLTIDGQQYDPAELSEQARTQIMQVKVTDEHIERLNQRLAIAQTARTAYARALQAALPDVAH